MRPAFALEIRRPLESAASPPIKAPRRASERRHVTGDALLPLHAACLINNFRVAPPGEIGTRRRLGIELSPFYSGLLNPRNSIPCSTLIPPLLRWKPTNSSISNDPLHARSRTEVRERKDARSLVSLCFFFWQTTFQEFLPVE